MENVQSKKKNAKCANIWARIVTLRSRVKSLPAMTVRSGPQLSSRKYLIFPFWPHCSFFPHIFLSVAGRHGQQDILCWQKHTQKSNFSVNMVIRTLSIVCFLHYMLSTQLCCFHCCTLRFLKFLSNHISGGLCCQIPWNLPEAFRINVAGPCAL